MEDGKSALLGFLKGMYDSVAGIRVLYELGRRSSQDSSATDLVTKQRAPSTTPTRRRVAPVTPRSADEPRVLQRIFQCCLLNGGVFGLSILVFYCALLPAVFLLIRLLFGGDGSPAGRIWSWLHPLLSYTFEALWVLPLFLLSKVVNSLWFQDIADQAYLEIRGRAPQLLPSLSRVLADTLFSVLVQTLFLLQSLLVAMLPLGPLGALVSLAHLSLLYSLYAFEYTWFNMGWELHKRLSFIEQNWPYFVGFGLPLAALTQGAPTFFASGCYFSVLFPLFIISAHEAVPKTDSSRFPLQLFSPSIWVSNAIFRQLTTNSAVSNPALDGLVRRTHSKDRKASRRHHALSRPQLPQGLAAS
ncbi:unnamed protein product [Ixodes pacificus]